MSVGDHGFCGQEAWPYWPQTNIPCNLGMIFQDTEWLVLWSAMAEGELQNERILDVPVMIRVIPVLILLQRDLSLGNPSLTLAEVTNDSLHPRRAPGPSQALSTSGHVHCFQLPLGWPQWQVCRSLPAGKNKHGLTETLGFLVYPHDLWNLFPWPQLSNWCFQFWSYLQGLLIIPIFVTKVMISVIMLDPGSQALTPSYSPINDSVVP